jgi:hypothetical protein
MTIDPRRYSGAASDQYGIQNCPVKPIANPIKALPTRAAAKCGIIWMQEPIRPTIQVIINPAFRPNLDPMGPATMAAMRMKPVKTPLRDV